MAGRSELGEALAARAEGFREHVPVFRVSTTPLDQQRRRALALAGLLWDLRGDCSPSDVGMSTGTMYRLQLPEDGRLNLFPASGAIDAYRSSATSREPLATDLGAANRKEIASRLRSIGENIGKHFVDDDEELRPERIWETKGRSVTLRGVQGRTTLLEVVGALRRFIRGVPVLGRASVHVALAGSYELTKWGVDWRRQEGKPIANASIVDPAEGARRLLAELQMRRPEKAITVDDLEPERMTLGYISMPRRQRQNVLQPGWVGMFRSRGRATMGHIIVVPAAPTAFEPVGLVRLATSSAVRIPSFT